MGDAYNDVSRLLGGHLKDDFLERFVLEVCARVVALGSVAPAVPVLWMWHSFVATCSPRCESNGPLCQSDTRFGVRNGRMGPGIIVHDRDDQAAAALLAPIALQAPIQRPEGAH